MTTIGTPMPPSPSTYLEPVNFPVTVMGNYGAPGGTVTLADNGTPVGSCMPLTPGQNNQSTTTCTVSTLAVGDHPDIVITYNGDDKSGGFAGSMSDPVDYMVGKAGTKTVISDVEPPSPSTYGTQVTFTAMVTGDNGGSPTGTVTIWDVTDPKNQVMICTTPNLQPNGSKGKRLPQGNGSMASCPTDPNNPLTGGTHMIDAVYNPNGDPDFTTSTSDPIKYVVSKAKPKFEPLKSSKNPSTYGDPVTFTATLDGVAGGQQPTGNVVFTDTYNNVPTVICTSPLKQGANNSTATCSTPPPQLLGGSHSIVATYTDDGNYGPADPSAPLVQMVNRAKPKFEPLQSSKNPSTYGDTVTFTATLDGVSGYPQPTGNVVFTDTYKNTPTVICTSPLKPGANNSTATCTTPPPLLLGGSHSIVATYTDDTNYTSADPSAPLVQVVQKEKPKFEALQSSKNPSTYGDTLTFTATLDGVSGDPQPTGTVVFTDTYNNIPTVICTSPLSPGANNSSATCTNPNAAIPYLLGGSHNIVATYVDDNNYASADPSLPLVQTVQRARPTTSIASGPNPSVRGQTVIFTVPVTGVSGGLAPTGNVTFTYTNNGGNATPISECSNPIPLANNQATCTSKSLASGMDNVTAAYSGDNNYTDSEPSLTQIVQDFGFAGLPGLLTVIQGYDNNSNSGPYPQPASVTVSPLPPFPYNGTVTLACSVSPTLPNGPTCSLGTTSIPQGTGTASVTITTVPSTPIGPYNVTITGQDVADGGSPNSTVLAVSVAYYSSTLQVASGQPGITSVHFVGSAGVNVNFLCSQVTGPQGTQPYLGNTYHIGCTVNPGTALLSIDRSNPTSATVTITSSTLNAQLTVPGRILATLWLGMPAIVLVGSLRFGRLSRKRVLQLLGMLIVLVALLQGIGCGGGFTRPSSNTTAGFYSVLVVGQDSTGAVQASAAIPFQVVGGN